MLVGMQPSYEGFDGLLLPGGGDVAPERYGEPVDPLCGTPDPALDELQLTVLDWFVKNEKPVFGICRGIQVINVYFGGTLIQHVPDALHHMRTPGIPEDKVHLSHAESGSLLEKLYGT